MPEEEKTPVPDPTVLTTEQLLREVDRVKELMTSEIVGLKRLLDERFNSVDIQFKLIERQRVEQKADTSEAVKAALAAAKEAVKEQTTASEARTDRSEAATTKQLEQLNATVTTSFDDLKERVARIESLKQGTREALNGISALAGFLVSLVIIGGALAASGAFTR